MFLSLMFRDANNGKTLPMLHAKQTLQQFNKLESFKQQKHILQVSLTECKLFLSMLFLYSISNEESLRFVLAV